MKATCPDNPNHKRFITVVHVAENWVVDEEGNFLETHLPDEVETTHGPNPDNTWTCAECGADANVEQ